MTRRSLDQTKRSKWWTDLAGAALWGVVQFVCMTLHIRSIKEEHDSAYESPFLAAFWHNRTWVACYAWTMSQKSLQMCALTSASKDGALVSAICRHYGIETIRGSSSRRGAKAYAEMLAKVQNSRSCVAFTPDGPQGPIYQMHPGIIRLAAQTGLPIVPVCIDYKSCWRIGKTWDKYAIPKPCSDVHVLWKKRIFIPKNLTDEQVTTYSRRIVDLLSEGSPDFSPLI